MLLLLFVCLIKKKNDLAMWQIYTLVESKSEFLTYQVLTHAKNKLWERREMGQLLDSFTSECCHFATVSAPFQKQNFHL